MIMMNRNNKTCNEQRKKYNNTTRLLSSSLSSSFLLLLLIVIAQLSNNNNECQAQNNNIDYTCNPRDDYGTNNKCPTLEDGKCDDPKITTNGNDLCLNQDCIDCNSECKCVLCFVIHSITSSSK